MRAGPLSNDKVIALLNRFYIPVYTSNEDYADKSTAVTPEEKAEKQRIFIEFSDARLGTGDVHVYILKPDGHALAGLDIGSAMNIEKEVALLEQSAAKLGTAAGDPVIAPRATSAPPKADPGALILHLTARGQGTGPKAGSWREFPSENWIILKRDQWLKLLPSANPGPGAVGNAWDMDREVMAEPLHRFYPQTEETTDDARTQIDRQEMRATIVSIESGVTTARIAGKLSMRRTNTSGKPDSNLIEADIAGSIQWETTGKDAPRVRSLQLVTSRALHGKEPFEVAVQSVK